MKTLVACLLTALVAAGAAGAYTLAVTPQQFAALKQQVSALKQQVSGLQTQVTTLQGTSDNNGKLGLCLQKNWNAAQLWPSDTYGVNGAKYDASTGGSIASLSLVLMPTAGTTQC